MTAILCAILAPFSALIGWKIAEYRDWQRYGSHGEYPTKDGYDPFEPLIVKYERHEHGHN